MSSTQYETYHISTKRVGSLTDVNSADLPTYGATVLTEAMTAAVGAGGGGVKTTWVVEQPGVGVGTTPGVGNGYPSSS